MRGVLGGGFWGLVIGGVAVTSMSLVNEPPVLQEPSAISETPLADVPVVAENTNIANTDAAPQVVELPDADVVVPDAVPDAPFDDATALSARDTAPEIAEAAPLVAQTPDLAPEPAETAPVSDIAETSEIIDPIAPDVPLAVETPETADAPVEDVIAPATTEVTETIETPAAPEETEAPETVEVASTAPVNTETPASVAAAAVDNTAVALPETTSGGLPDAAPAEELAPPPATSETETIVASAEQPVLPNPQSQAPLAPAQETDITVDVNSVDDTPAATPVVIEDTPVPETIDDDTPVVEPAADPEIEDVDVQDTPIVTTLPAGNTGVVVNRFTSDADDAAETEEDAAVEETTAQDWPEGTPAVVRYAATYENPNDLPEIAVVLIDDGSFASAVDTVSAIGFPVSVMLDPSAPDAAGRLDAYRAAGIEVGILASVPPSATASDVAIFFEAALATLPETFAALEVPDPSGQTSPDVIRQTVAALGEDGRGLIAFERGLNTAQRVAAEEGVPAAYVFRDIDADDQNARVILRFLDQAAFRARQESGVIMLGRMRGETLTALVQWGNSSQVGQVAMVPVSATLNAEDEG